MITDRYAYDYGRTDSCQGAGFHANRSALLVFHPEVGFVEIVPERVCEGDIIALNRRAADDAPFSFLVSRMKKSGGCEKIEVSVRVRVVDFQPVREVHVLIRDRGVVGRHELTPILC